METLKPTNSEIQLPYSEDKSGKFKRVISLSKTNEPVSYVFISEDTKDFFGLLIDKSEEDSLTLQQIATQLSGMLKGGGIIITGSYFSDSVDKTKPISYYRDAQPLYFHFSKSMKLKILLDESIPSSSRSFEVEICEEWTLGDLQDLIAKTLGREYKGLAFKRLQFKEDGTSRSELFAMKSMNNNRGKEINLIIKDLTGKSHEVKVFDNDFIAKVLESYSRAVQISKESIRLIWRGKSLEDVDIISRLGLSDGDTIQAIRRLDQLKPERISPKKTLLIKQLFRNGEKILLKDHLAKVSTTEEFEVRVKTVIGKQISIFVSPLETIERVKYKIYEKEGIPPDKLRICYDGIGLDEESLVYEYDIVKGCLLHTVLKLRGGGSVGRAFVDITNEKSAINLRWSTSAPDWRIAEPGLCLEGICTNADCVASLRQVIMNMRMGTFDLMLDTENCKCPMCKEFVKPKSCGFNNCCYTYSGIITLDNGQPQRIAKQEWIEVGNLYKYFDPRGSGVAQWVNLKIYTKYKSTKPEEHGVCCLLCKKTIKKGIKSKLNCGHVFHFDCYARLVDGLGKECPLCHLH